MKFVDPEDPETSVLPLPIKQRPFSLKPLEILAYAFWTSKKLRKLPMNLVFLIIDNTSLPRYFRKPIEFGADIVIHSATKWLLGNGTSTGGVIVDGGKFDWNSPKFPGFTTPDASYHDLVYAQALGAVAYIIKARVQLLRDLRTSLKSPERFPICSWSRTLHVRMKEHVANTKEVVAYLVNHPAVEWVLYPGNITS